MIQRTPAGVRDDYMLRLRRCLRGVSPDVADEVEREIGAHIDDALAAHGAEDEASVRDVLERLGPPEEYVRDWALYLMVDRGYRDWSVPHMVRSAAFWGCGTLAGAVAVLGFGSLYGLSLVSVYVGLGGSLVPMVIQRLDRTGEGDFGGVNYVTGWGFVLLGLVGLVAVTVLVRWFIGQYVRRARPHAFGMEVGDGWAQRTSRRIVAVAAGGVVVSVFCLVLSIDTPVVLVAAAGLLGLSPVIGLLWSAWAEGP